MIMSVLLLQVLNGITNTIVKDMKEVIEMSAGTLIVWVLAISAVYRLLDKILDIIKNNQTKKKYSWDEKDEFI